MAASLVSLLWATIVAILIARAVRQGRHFASVPADARPSGPLPSIEVIVPARDEATRIGRCLAGLRAQSYPADRLRITVVDDGSTDATARIVAEASAKAANLRLLEAAPLPPGWFGKSHACWQASRGATAEWLCFVDADTCPAPALLAAALGTAQRRGLDMLSLEPFQELGGFWERLVLPTGFLLLAFFRDLRRFNDAGSAAATANGQFILIRRAVYEAVGGHEAVRSEIAEDKRLAERVKHAGYRVADLGGERLIRTRMYTGFRSLWQGLSKHAAELAGGVGRLLLYAAAGVVLGVAEIGLPAWSASRLIAAPGSGNAVAATVLAAAGTLALLGIRAGTLRHFRVPLGYVLLSSVSHLAVLLIAVTCAVQRITGRTVWKHRAYPLAASLRWPRQTKPREGGT